MSNRAASIAAMAGVVKGRVEAERLGLAPAACSLSAGTPAPLTADKTLLAGRLVQEPPPPDYLLQDLLVRGIVGAVVAMGGVGKTFFLLQLAHALASGGNLGPIRATRPARTLMLAAEDSQVELDRRLWPSRPFPEKLHVAGVAGMVEPLMYLEGARPVRSEWYTWLRQTVEAHSGLEVLILDPKSRFYGLEENDNGHATAWIATLETLAADYGLTVLFAHHVAKARAESLNQNMSRGASALVDGCRWVAGLSPMSGPVAASFDIHDPRPYLEFDILKSNYAPALPAKLFFKRGANGLLEHVNLRADRAQAMAEHLCTLLAREQSSLTRRELTGQASGKAVAEGMKEAFGGFVRSRDMALAINCALERGLLFENPGQSPGRRPRRELHLAGPIGGDPVNE